ncbi:ABC transporter ATP-binding protein [Streptomonospora litoralis]|uniref:Putative ABC transporter ATP-binding protein YbhF n=1 Tax=Streptomonospora litoralis TaxID=2498135 RepID=A0A4V0ZK74_9ACTN|nr:ATP-binding cassette domain-containing protein [Streptomonospora litoralis]QBI55992.1 putative ABC transporter ATP-binding protein YbhF [Streptomonospora litoralis]
MGGKDLQIDRVSKRYGDVHALREMTFDVGEGGIFGFVGGNGAGKTTTMRIILGVLAADSGEVRWRGEPIGLETRRDIGYMPEERGLYPKMGVRDQLMYLARLHGIRKRAAGAAADEWLERFGLTERRRDELDDLSLGNQQKVQLAAALIHDPEVLVLDEPFSGLDPMAVDVMSEVLRKKAAAGVPVIFSSHQLDLVERLCDRVGIVRAGSMVACGPVGELRDGSRRRFEIEIAGGPTGWADELDGVSVLGASGDRVRVELAPGADEQAVLAAAMRSGPVGEFVPLRPTLAELFRTAVNGEESE